MSESPPRPPDDSNDDTGPVGRSPAEVLVIGGGGFIGSHLIDLLVNERVAVDVVDDLSSGSLANLADARNASRLTGADLRIHTVDAGSADLGTLISLRRPQQIIHLALLTPGRTTPTELGRSFTSMLAAAGHGEPARLTGDGRQTRDFVYVDDVVDAVMRARQRGSGLVVNVGTGLQTSLRELATLVNAGGPQPTFVVARDDELSRFSVSPVRARIHLGWAPWTSLAEGLAALASPRPD